MGDAVSIRERAAHCRESDRLSNACEIPTERLVVWTLLDTRLRVADLCGLTSKNIFWQQRQLRVEEQARPPRRKKTKTRVVPMSDADGGAAIIRITGGIFRLLDRPLSQVGRILEINGLETVTREVIGSAQRSW